MSKKKPDYLPLANIQIAGSHPMFQRAGGIGALHVIENPAKRGAFQSAYRLGPEGKKFIDDWGGMVAVTLTLDLNFDGHPAVTVALQAVNVHESADFNAKHAKGLADEIAAKRKKPRILKPGDK